MRSITPGSILVTGASSGIGFDTACQLRDIGRDVICTVRSQSDFDRLTELGFKVVRMDASDATSTDTAFSDAVRLAHDGRLTAIFLNAGYGQPGAIEDLSRSVFEEQFAVNVFGPVQLAILAVNHMRQFGQGTLLLNSSVLGFTAMKLRGPYVSSKFALEGFADVLRLEVASAGIHVSVLQPGPVLTRFRARSLKAFLSLSLPPSTRFGAAYDRMVSRLSNPGPAVPFTASSAECARVAVAALTAFRPRSRYRVTLQTKVFAVLKRVLPTSWLDAVLGKS